MGGTRNERESRKKKKKLPHLNPSGNTATLINNEKTELGMLGEVVVVVVVVRGGGGSVCLLRRSQGF